MARPIEYKKEFCDIAKKILANGESLAAVCDELDIARPTLAAWRQTYPEFGESVALGLQKAQRDWERIGRDGVVGNYDKFASTSWIFTMKNRFRDDYAEEKQDKSASETLVEKLLDRLID